MAELTRHLLTLAVDNELDNLSGPQDGLAGERLDPFGKANDLGACGQGYESFPLCAGRQQEESATAIVAFTEALHGPQRRALRFG